MSPARDLKSLSYIATVALAAIATAGKAFAFPAFAVNTEGNCFACHDQFQTGRFEAFNHDGIVDPQERPGVPDAGALKYFTVEQGGVASLGNRAVNGEENYAFQVKKFEDRDVTAAGVLVYAPDPDWSAFEYFDGIDRVYFTRSDGDFDGYDWNTSDPTEVSYDLGVSEATGPGYYLVTLALAGRDPSRLGWYQEELVYVEVTNTPNVMDLVATDLIRGQNATVQASEATPNQMVYFAYSLSGIGETFVPQLNVTLALDRPRLLGQSRANSSGVARFTQRIPPGAPQVEVFIQAAQAGKVSNVHADVIQ